MGKSPVKVITLGRVQKRSNLCQPIEIYLDYKLAINNWNISMLGYKPSMLFLD